MGIFERHPTGTTIVGFMLLVVIASALPLPDWARPLDVFQQERPLVALTELIFKPAESAPRKGDVAAADFAITEEEPPVEEDDTMKPELAVVHNAPDVQKVRPKAEPWKRPARPKLDSYRQKLGFTGVDLEESCADPLAAEKDQPCKRRSLDRFFQKLDRAYDREDGAVARVVHYGDSIIASDHITDVVRLRLQERFGSAGKGLLLVARYNARQRRLRTGDGVGWKPQHIAQGELPDFDFGYAGSAFTAEKDGASSVFDVGESRFADIFYLQHADSGPIDIVADDKLVKTIETKDATRAAKIAAVELPEGTKTMRLVAKKAGTRIFGVALEARVPGVIYESIGVPGTTSEVWLWLEKSGFDTQLAHRDPSLVVTMLGGNDARTMHQKRKTAEQVEKSTRDFVRALKKAAPQADCLIVSPLDGVVAKASGEMKSKPEVAKVIAIQRQIAREEGCAFWDMYTSMGGAGSLEKWFKAGIFNPDLIHPKATAGDMLGEMMAEALMNAYDARHAERAELTPGD